MNVSLDAVYDGYPNKSLLQRHFS